MEASTQVIHALNTAYELCCVKIRVLMKDGFKDNKKQIRALQREKQLYFNFKNRIDKMENTCHNVKYKES